MGGGSEQISTGADDSDRDWPGAGEDSQGAEPEERGVGGVSIGVGAAVCAESQAVGCGDSLAVFEGDLEWSDAGGNGRGGQKPRGLF